MTFEPGVLCVHLSSTGMESLPDPAFAVDARGIVLTWNAAAEALTGWPAEIAVGSRYRVLLDGLRADGRAAGAHDCPLLEGLRRTAGDSDQLPLRRRVTSRARNVSDHPLAHPDLLVRCADGTRRMLTVIGLPAVVDGTPSVVHVLRGNASSEHDGLTLVLTREALAARFLDEQHRASRFHAHLALALVDVDHLKHLNDTAGHCGGDRALVTMAAGLQGERRGDLVGRWGGDEFAVLLPGSTKEQARARLRRTLGKLGRATGRTVPASFCAGVVDVAPEDTLLTAVARADRLLYSAKDAGPGTVICR